jgi:hypothetical protein
VVKQDIRTVPTDTDEVPYKSFEKQTRKIILLTAYTRQKKPAPAETETDKTEFNAKSSFSYIRSLKPKGVK